MASERSVAYRHLTHPATWVGVAFVAAGAIVPLVLYPEHPGVVSTTALIALLCGIAATRMAQYTEISREEGDTE
ncbi:hypothetical protein [Halorubrum lipolyticum]|uniref:Uncharacterized protein n=1 Tax=Halorubrum lipolyticum DSM 21995 TaxID=1227482 RepID=M0NHB0_9EURY|nr:hypothetical protein [Halorubrum lipolyticum]EMA57251.1 hypothetical protein C469_16003 [Halorubrum lipolyticum DSM 21995]